ncbi:iron chelate uptake ABC transporter family permease subunit [Microbacterium hominis]|uniref:FecCD family ABC transporter permease n=1 Tax=Microbacterium TaxID=33882 RepID=UPI00168BE14C|nr:MULTISPECIES: iron chelate uptake ABC transporter family permease subunit [Microbacterium]QOC25689.1 iron chelate uptake ABC transporter family permease subunit [Microbacterium hominis]QOC29684.1 iron chelate uptake ABC transporter family permease subunit [Microbacterium hominis]QYF97937.1 iron chelate uptake ABC transporter family permease subunit [Microbacterium sp. PAMC21962]
MSASLAVRRTVARRRMRVVGVLALVAVVVIAVALSVGDYPLAPDRLWQTLTGSGTRIEQYVVFQVRAPRAAMAVVAGAALGVAGALLQTYLGNPLASPDLLGISGGSGVAAVTAILVFGTTGPVLVAFAFAGGIAVAALLLVAGRTLRDGGFRLILAGIGISFLSAALINLMMVRAKVEEARLALLWLTGSLASTPWWQVATVGGILILLVPALVVAGRWLPITQLGHETANGLGVASGAVRIVVVAAAVLLTAATSAFVGPISFIALCAPAIARALLRQGAVGVVTSGVVGAVLLLAADLVAQFAIPGMSLPVGIVTGAVGALFLLWLLATSKGRQL